LTSVSYHTLGRRDLEEDAVTLAEVMEAARAREIDCAQQP
jgi:hypothetical protein